VTERTGTVEKNRPAGVRTPAEEQELVRKARDGDRDAFSDLIEQRGPGVLAFLRRMLGDAEDARDVAQLTFVRVWENLHKYDPAWAFSTWLFRIASNLAIDAIRSRQSRERTGHEHIRLAGSSAGQVEPEAHGALATGEARRIFEACSTGLSEKQRLVFVLREFEEKETSEIAGMMGCRESTVRNHLFQARQVLREEIRRRFPEYVPVRREKP
jgi:RNA polymerase sigma-70 factor (ECF subfamily)